MIESLGSTKQIPRIMAEIRSSKVNEDSINSRGATALHVVIDATLTIRRSRLPIHTVIKYIMQNVGAH